VHEGHCFESEDERNVSRETNHEIDSFIAVEDIESVVREGRRITKDFLMVLSGVPNFEWGRLGKQ
jgi:hypothetical protein